MKEIMSLLGQLGPVSYILFILFTVSVAVTTFKDIARKWKPFFAILVVGCSLGLKYYELINADAIQKKADESVAAILNKIANEQDTTETGLRRILETLGYSQEKIDGLMPVLKRIGGRGGTHDPDGLGKIMVKLDQVKMEILASNQGLGNGDAPEVNLGILDRLGDLEQRIIAVQAGLSNLPDPGRSLPPGHGYSTPGILQHLDHAEQRIIRAVDDRADAMKSQRDLPMVINRTHALIRNLEKANGDAWERLAARFYEIEVALELALDHMRQAQTHTFLEKDRKDLKIIKESLIRDIERTEKYISYRKCLDTQVFNGALGGKMDCRKMIYRDEPFPEPEKEYHQMDDTALYGGH